MKARYGHVKFLLDVLHSGWQFFFFKYLQQYTVQPHLKATLKLKPPHYDHTNTHQCLGVCSLFLYLDSIT